MCMTNSNVWTYPSIELLAMLVCCYPFTIFLCFSSLKVFGGGKLTSKYLHIEADEVIVDTKGSISVTGQGYQANGK